MTGECDPGLRLPGVRAEPRGSPQRGRERGVERARCSAVMPTISPSIEIPATRSGNGGGGGVSMPKWAQ
jgi:hypothetical protein